MRILIVDDEEEIGLFLKKRLETECYIVDWAPSGEAGLDFALKTPYNLAIFDYNLPGISGQDLCAKIRSNNLKFPIIILSVNSETSTKISSLNTGADDYLTKPFSFEELLARIRALLRRPNNLDHELLRFADLTLDIKKHKVTKGDKEIYLTKKEFQLLQYLLRHKGTVLSRGMILDHVWDMNADPFSNTIESHIVSIRRKIKDNNSKKRIIKTISGLGYKIDD